MATTPRPVQHLSRRLRYLSPCWVSDLRTLPRFAGVKWNSVGFPNPQHKQYIQAPEQTGLYFFHAEAENGDFFSFPWIVAPPPLDSSSGEQREAKVALLLANMNWNAYNNFGGRSNVRIDELVCICITADSPVQGFMTCFVPATFNASKCHWPLGLRHNGTTAVHPPGQAARRTHHEC